MITFGLPGSEFLDPSLSTFGDITHYLPPAAPLTAANLSISAFAVSLSIDCSALRTRHRDCPPPGPTPIRHRGVATGARVIGRRFTPARADALPIPGLARRSPGTACRWRHPARQEASPNPGDTSREDRPSRSTRSRHHSGRYRTPTASGLWLTPGCCVNVCLGDRG